MAKQSRSTTAAHGAGSPVNGAAALRPGLGVLMHVTSLPSEYGVGTVGREAYRFAELLAEGGCGIWALLPTGATGYGDSPYQSFSSFALDPYFLDLEGLIGRGLLTREECAGVDWGGDPRAVDYGALYKNRLPLLLTAFARAMQEPGFEGRLAEFAAARPDVCDYALYMAIKDMTGGLPWYEWPEGLKRREPAAMEEAASAVKHEYRFYLFIQMELFASWKRFKQHANSLGLRLMGDMPIYCAYDSADCWAHPECFQLDEDMRPTLVAGVPPDYFSPLGQKWGNPLFDWKALERAGFRFWLNRIGAAAELCDILRIDHFRGFAGYYAIPADMPDARVGEWKKGCGAALFKRVREEYPALEIVAEDLGFITPDVKRLLTQTGFAGMQVMEFAFGGGRGNPHKNRRWDGDPAHIRNKACYTGTHDNPPVAAWWRDIGREERMRALRYAGLTMRNNRGRMLYLAGDDDCANCPEERAEACRYRGKIEKRRAELAAYYLTNAVANCDAKYRIVPAQDLLCLGAEARMNTPGTDSGNWQWRATKEQTERIGERLKELRSFPHE